MRKGLLLGLGALLLPPTMMLARTSLPTVLPTATEQPAAVVEKTSQLPAGLFPTMLEEMPSLITTEPAAPATTETVPPDPKETAVPAANDTAPAAPKADSDAAAAKATLLPAPKETTVPAANDTAPAAPKADSDAAAAKATLLPAPKETTAPAANAAAPAAANESTAPVSKEPAPEAGTENEAPATKETAPAAPKADSDAPAAKATLLPAPKETAAPVDLPIATQPGPEGAPGMGLLNLPIATQPAPEGAPGMDLPPSTLTILTPGKSAPGMPVVEVPGASCVDGCCGNCCDCSEPQQQRVWANAEFLLWWTKSAPVNNPLLTAATNTNDPNSGALGSANTAVLLGGQSYGVGTRYGGRFAVGAWLDPDCQVGVEAGYLFLAPSSTTKQFGSDGSPGSQTVGLPINFPGSGETFLPVGSPFSAGGAFLTLQNSLQSAELNGLFRVFDNDCFTVSGLVGARYIYFKETMTFGEAAGANAAGPGTTFTSIDHFEAVNNFYGGQLGLRGEYRMGGFFVNGTAKVALGATYQTVNISGGSVLTAPTGNLSGPIGLYALPSNIGHASTQRFAVAPEVGLNAGYDITRNIRAYVGYTFLYINNVARPGQQLDHSVNITQQNVVFPGSTLVGPAVPVFPFNHTDFWAQGINFGLALKW